MHVLRTATAIDVDATCKIGDHCENDTPQQVSQIAGYTSLSSQHTVGLTPAEIDKIAGRTAVVTEAEAAEDRECPICLNDLNSGDKVRHLASCGHTFHRSCIDLWLLRRADCPLCKSEVKSVVRRCASPRLGPLRV